MAKNPSNANNSNDAKNPSNSNNSSDAKTSAAENIINTKSMNSSEAKTSAKSATSVARTTTKKAVSTIAVILAAIVLFTASSYAWFSEKDRVIFPTSFGSTQAAYFAGGDGSKNNPYLIANPVHFYNLAWLQYLGYFNLRSDLNNGRAQSYFKLSNDVNMSGLVIPPIGTKNYPFIGNFDGNGNVLTNVTVSNLLGTNDITRYPTAAVFGENDKILKLHGTGTSDTDDKNNVSVLGLFGIIGDYTSNVEGTTTATYVNANYVNKADINVHDNAETPEGDVGENDFYYSQMGISGFYADKVTVKSSSNKTLVGLVAGYAAANVQNVGVYRATVNLASSAQGETTLYKAATGEAAATPIDYDTVVSKYSLVGDYDDNLVDWAEKPAEIGGTQPSDTNAWGGSIDMRTINRRLGYMIAKVGKINESNVSNFITATDTKLGINVYRSGKSEYYWNYNDTSYAVLYLDDGTVLPINVDKKTMGIDQIVPKSDENPNGFEETTNTTTRFHYNSWYADSKNTTEVIATNNTGYIVGGGSKSSGYIRARIQPIASGPSTYENGIYKSLGYSTMQTSAVTYNKDNFKMLTIDANGKVYAINDDVNKNSTVNDYSFTTNPTSIDYNDTKLRFNSSGELYLKVRKEFDETMEGSSVVHGFHFMNKISASSYETTYKTVKINDGKGALVEYEKYPLIKGGVNFTVSEAGVIKTILGAFFSQKNNSMFDLYKVKRNDDKTKIESVTRIANIYRDANGEIEYNSTDTTKTKVFDFDTLTESDKLETATAYYFEIPVTAGDYVIGADQTSSRANAYLMYLDIGANGDGETGGTTPTPSTKPYTMDTVDFVTVAEGSADLTVPTQGEGNEEASFYPQYADVTVKLSGVDQSSAATVEYARNTYDAATATNIYNATKANKDGWINTKLSLYTANVTATINPTDLGDKKDSSIFQ